MATRYAITGQENAVTTGLTTALDLVGASTSRPEIDFVMASVGSAATLADQCLRVVLMRHTTANTMTAVTPAPIDPSAPAAVATAGENASGEGTYTAATELLDQTIHVRGQLQWWASGPEGRLIVPATASNGIGLRVLAAAYTGTFDATMHFVGP